MPTKFKTVVYTFRYGHCADVKHCAKSLELWCSRHNYDLVIWDDSKITKGKYPHQKFDVIDMMEEFLSSDYDYFIVVDADVMFSLEAGPFDHGAKSPADPCVCAHRDGEGIHLLAYRTAVASFHATHYGIPPSDKPLTVPYYNAGFWGATRAGVQLLRSVDNGVYIDNTMEQNTWNAWIMLSGIRVEEQNPDTYLLACQLPMNKCRARADSEWHSFHCAGDKSAAYARACATLPGAVSRPDIYDLADMEMVASPNIAHVMARSTRPLKWFDTSKHYVGPRAVVWPWRGASAAWDELRYSMRSVEKFLDDNDCPMIVLSDFRPNWLAKNSGRVKWIQSWTYEDCISIGTQIADQVLWMNDDIFLLQPCTWESFNTWLYSSDAGADRAVIDKLMGDRSNSWKRGLGASLDMLSAAGFTTRNYSLHKPYLYNRAHSRRILRTTGVFHKIPFETLYGNTITDRPHYQHPFPGSVTLKKHEGEVTGRVPFGDAKFLNVTDDRLTQDVKAELMKMFPVKCNFEHPTL